MHERPTFGSLFAGIGGIDLGLERAGWECRFQVEWDAYCQRVLAKHWPDVSRYGDITGVDWTGVERVDLLAGGFPCQPVSNAGRRAAQADPRWLWPEFHRAIRALRPRLVLVENVTNLLGINGGSAFGEVVGDLAASGYDAEWDCIPASAVGALHERDRVWVIAYPNGEQLRDEPGRSRGSGREGPTIARDDGSSSTLADADRERLSIERIDVRGNGHALAGGDPDGRGSPPPMADAGGAGSARVQGRPTHGVLDWGGRLGGDDGESGGAAYWRTEPPVGRVVDGLPRGLARRRTAALKGTGNAVVPQVVQVIGERLLAAISDTAASARVAG